MRGCSLPAARWKEVVILFVLAFALRLWGIGLHSFSFDEAQSVYLAAQPAARILDDGLHLRTDPHPPGYYLLLHGWMALFGDSDIAARTLGALIGAGLTLAVYATATLLGGRGWGLLAGLLAAVSPYLIWYAQETRIFMLGVALAVAGWALLLAGMQRSGWGWWLGYVLAAVASVYTFLFTLFLLPAQGLYLLIWWGGKRGRGPQLRRGVLAQIVIALAVLPLLGQAWVKAEATNLEGTPVRAVGALLHWLYRAYTLHLAAWPALPTTAALVAGLLLLALGLLARPGRQEERAGPALLGLWLFVPLLIGLYFEQRQGGVFSFTRYFIMLTPALMLAWGRGLAVLWRWRPRWGGMAALLWLGVLLAALPANFAPQNLREDWRTAARYVTEQEGTNDAILVHVDYLHVAFERYFQGQSPIFFPFSDQITGPAQVEPPLMGLLPFDSVWLVQAHTLYFDPDQQVERWLADRFPLATAHYPNGVTVKRYLTRYRLPAPPAALPRLDAPFGPDISLAACRAAPLQTPATDRRSHPPSAWIHVQLYWQAHAVPPADYTTSARMIDSQGQVWGERLTRERETLRLWPTSRWQPGEVVREDLDVNLNPITPPGPYRIVVALLDPTAAPLGAEVGCGEILID